ncbi:MAG: hypothetical protein QF535_10300, partial [Anaerolineales bacterium]|nr:hypothetical protein [Anaerolineales bacterium]
NGSDDVAFLQFMSDGNQNQSILFGKAGYSGPGVSGTDSAGQIIYEHTSSGATQGFHIKAGSAATEVMTILGSGNVGIGTDSPQHELQVKGNITPVNGWNFTKVVADDATSVLTGVWSDIYCPTDDDCKIAYRDETNDNLMFADCNDEMCSSPTLTTIDSETNTGSYVSIYCPSATNCKIAYYETSPSAGLRFADCNDATCSAPTLTDLHTGSNVGRATDIYCPSSADCKIAYYDASGGDLEFADCDAEDCSSNTLTTVDGDTAGNWPSIYCPTATDCKISYHDVGSKDLNMADCNDATCSAPTLTTVDSTTSADTGDYTSIYCPSATDCKISYFDNTNDNLMFADCTDAACTAPTLTTVDDSTNVGEWTSLDCPDTADCRISYYDAGNTAINLIDCDSTTCNMRTVSVANDYGGGYTGIHCPSADNCKISHLISPGTDLGFIDLKYAENSLGTDTLPFDDLFVKKTVRLRESPSDLTCDETTEGTVAYLTVSGSTKHYGCDGSSWNALY